MKSKTKSFWLSLRHSKYFRSKILVYLTTISGAILSFIQPTNYWWWVIPLVFSTYIIWLIFKTIIYAWIINPINKYKKRNKK